MKLNLTYISAVYKTVGIFKVSLLNIHFILEAKQSVQPGYIYNLLC